MTDKKVTVNMGCIPTLSVLGFLTLIGWAFLDLAWKAAFIWAFKVWLILVVVIWGLLILLGIIVAALK